MFYKTSYIAQQYITQDSELRRVLSDLDDELAERGIAAFTITEGWRRHSENIATYTANYLAEKKTLAEAKRLAEEQFSYHLVGSAVDFRSSGKEHGTPYTTKERLFILEWLRPRCPKDKWEVLEHNVGTGLHFHLARKNLDARAKWEASKKRIA